MGKLTFKNKILNLVTAGLFFVAAVIGLIGLLGVHQIDYLSVGLYYILGIGSIVFAGINMFASFKKANKKEGNISIIIINLINVVLGLILFIHIMKVRSGNATYSNDEFWFNPARVFGLVLYLEGIELVLVSKFNVTTTIKRTLLGIFFVTFGAVSFIWLKSEHISYTLDVLLFLFALYYLYVGLRPQTSKKINQNVSLNEEELPKKKQKKSLFTRKNKEIETNSSNQIEKNKSEELPLETEEEKHTIDDLFD